MVIDVVTDKDNRPTQEIAPGYFLTGVEKYFDNLAEVLSYDIGFKWQWANMEIIERGTSLLSKMCVDKFILESKTLSLASKAAALRSGLPVRIDNPYANAKKNTC